jgi:cytochrome P450
MLRTHKYPPGPKGNLIFGIAGDFLRNALESLQKAAPYGDIVHFRVLHKHLYFLNHPDYIHQVLVEQQESFYKETPLKKGLYPLLGNGLILKDGNEHREARRRLQPAFYHKRLVSYAQTMLDKTEAMLSRWEHGLRFDLKTEMSALALGIVGKTLFGTDDIAHHAKPIGDAVTKILKAIGKEGRTLKLPGPKSRKRQREKLEASALLNKIIYDMIAARREDRGDDLISMLLDTHYEDGTPLPESLIRDEVLTMFIAGHETTANALTWTFFLLNNNPQVYEKLRHEVNITLAGEAINFDTAPRFKYTEMVIKETLRLYPPGWMFTREPIQDVIIGGYRVKKGDIVIVSPFITHRDSRYFDCPDDFNPERFTPDHEKTIARSTYFPFGSGARVCMGDQFAMLEAKLVLASIIRHGYRLNIDQHNVRLKGGVTLVPGEPLIVTVIK